MYLLPLVLKSALGPSEKPLERNAVSVVPAPPTSAALELDDQYAYTERTESKILCMSADVRSLIHTRSGVKPVVSSSGVWLTITIPEPPLPPAAGVSLCALPPPPPP